jgi:NAD(P)-dependent dehydrogenase (short-subunit alcohol dehydrogenase family)
MEDPTRPTAFVTGASRGIGKAVAIALAEAGFDVAISARTVHEGDGRDATTNRTLPGSLDTTVAAVEAAGVRGLPIAMDLMDDASIDTATTRLRAEWGVPDVLVNNAIYQGPARTSRFLDSSQDELHRLLIGNVLSQWRIIRAFLPDFIARGSGTILDVTSAAGMIDPPKPTGEGGWSLGYGASKGAFHRTCGVLHAEHSGDGVRIFNLEPGLVHTERMRLGRDDEYEEVAGAGTTPDVIARVAVWLVTSPDAEKWRGRTLHAQPLAEKMGWKAPA